LPLSFAELLILAFVFPSLPANQMPYPFLVQKMNQKHQRFNNISWEPTTSKKVQILKTRNKIQWCASSDSAGGFYRYQPNPTTRSNQGHPRCSTVIQVNGLFHGWAGILRPTGFRQRHFFKLLAVKSRVELKVFKTVIGIVKISSKAGQQWYSKPVMCPIHIFLSQSHRPFESESSKFFSSHDWAESSQNLVTRIVEMLRSIGLQAQITKELHEI